MNHDKHQKSASTECDLRTCVSSPKEMKESDNSRLVSLIAGLWHQTNDTEYQSGRVVRTLCRLTGESSVGEIWSSEAAIPTLKSEGILSDLELILARLERNNAVLYNTNNTLDQLV